jgi:uncharacterized membrane protein
VLTSINAVLNNKTALFIWALFIVLALVIGFMTVFLGLAVLMPVVGYATWHGYRATIQADAWPRHGELPPG